MCCVTLSLMAAQPELLLQMEMCAPPEEMQTVQLSAGVPG